MKEYTIFAWKIFADEMFFRDFLNLLDITLIAIFLFSQIDRRNIVY